VLLVSKELGLAVLMAQRGKPGITRCTALNDDSYPVKIGANLQNQNTIITKVRYRILIGFRVYLKTTFITD
jgi:hypothetical protein